MKHDDERPGITRRELVARITTTAVVSVIATPLAGAFTKAFALAATAEPVNAVAGIDRVVMKHGKTYLRGWAGYGAPPRAGNGGRRTATPTAPPGPPPSTVWSKVSGPGTVTFGDATAASTTAQFSATGDYVLQVAASNGDTKATSTLTVRVELPPPPERLSPVVTKRHTITSPLWHARTKTLITSWIPHCIETCNRTDIPAGRGDGGIDNFIEAAKALRGEPYAPHKGYVFSNAWVHQTVESMSLALMVDAQGDQQMVDAQMHMRATLDDWIPKILAAQHADGYLQTAFTLRNAPRPGGPGLPGGSQQPWTQRWQPSARANHEGYVGGYFLESAINHYSMTEHKDARLYNAAKKLADCWADNIGPAPKQEWFDGHQEMEQALVRFGRFVNEVEPGNKGDRYVALAKFLLDCRKSGSEYDQSHLPVVEQYEAVGHAVRAVYTYSGMADVAAETHDEDYQSAVKSIWDNIVHRKYYLTGGVGSGETSEGFGPNYSLRNNSYCEACSSCGEIFFQWKLHLAYHEAKYADLYEQTLYNALLGAINEDGTRFFYTNPLAQTADRSAWHSVPCCTGNIPRTLLMLPTWMYSKGADSIYVNLFAGSKITVEGVAGTDVELVQDTDYPHAGKVAIVVNPTANTLFSIHLRVPTRDVSDLYTATPNANGMTSLSVNGRAMKPTIIDGYATIKRTWAKGDRIEFELPMHAQRVHASEKVDADKDRVALRYGPLVYNIEKVDQDVEGVLDPSATLTTEWRGDLLGGITVIKGVFAGGTPFTAIPHYARFNRQPPTVAVTAPDSAQRAQGARDVAIAAAKAVAAGQPLPRPAASLPTSIVWIKETALPSVRDSAR